MPQIHKDCYSFEEACQKLRVTSNELLHLIYNEKSIRFAVKTKDLNLPLAHVINAKQYEHLYYFMRHAVYVSDDSAKAIAETKYAKYGARFRSLESLTCEALSIMLDQAEIRSEMELSSQNDYLYVIPDQYYFIETPEEPVRAHIFWETFDKDILLAFKNTARPAVGFDPLLLTVDQDMPSKVITSKEVERYIASKASPKQADKYRWTKGFTPLEAALLASGLERFDQIEDAVREQREQSTPFPPAGQESSYAIDFCTLINEETYFPRELTPTNIEQARQIKAQLEKELMFAVEAKGNISYNGPETDLKIYSDGHGYTTITRRSLAEWFRACGELEMAEKFHTHLPREEASHGPVDTPESSGFDTKERGEETVNQPTKSPKQRNAPHPCLDTEREDHAHELSTAVELWTAFYINGAKPSHLPHTAAANRWLKDNCDLSETAKKRIVSVTNPTTNKNDGTFREK